MARITVEDCLKKVNNRFMLIHMAAKRVRQLRKGDEPTIQSKNRDIVVSLREIAAGNITAMEEQPKEELKEALAEALSASTQEEASQDVQEKEVETSEGN
jgi:DNA-directed RNA polymerase subunit omega